LDHHDARERRFRRATRINGGERMTPTPCNRIPYSAVVDRPALKLADAARMVLWTIVNVEDWSTSIGGGKVRE
jgi:hypothetical protein